MIKAKITGEIIIPEKEIIEFKEALIFAFLGTLNHVRKINISKMVTGADYSTISGASYDAFNSNRN